MAGEKINANIAEEEKRKVQKEALLKELSIDIGEKYKITPELIQGFVSRETLFGLDELKQEIQKEQERNTENNEHKEAISKKDLEKLFFSLKGAQEVIENISKLEIKVLKDSVEDSIDIQTFKNTLEQYLPNNLLEKAKNPKKPHEHVLGIALGTGNSIIATAEALYQIGVGIIKAPYDIYLVMKGEATIKTDI